MPAIDRLVPRGQPVARMATPVDAWLAREPDDLAPVVLIAGGFLTMPRWYRGLTADLLRGGAADVVVAPVYTQDWVLAAVRGLGPIVTRVGRTLLEASARSAESEASLGAPILLVGHSAGGIVGRLLTSPVPFAGRRTNAAERIGALVTLGTPHVVGEAARWGRHVADAGVRFANREVPGAFFAPTTGYLAVGSRRIVGQRDAEGGRGRLAYQVYQDVAPGAEPAAAEGDGLVPLAAALLPGAHHLVLEHAVHGPGTASEWYGRTASVEAWWPAALATWRAALGARRQRHGRDREPASDPR